MLGRLLTSSNQDGTIKKLNRESVVRELHVCNNIFFNHFCTSGHCSFLEDVSVTFIDKTDTSDLLKRKGYWRSTLKTMAPFGLNIEESVQQFYYVEVCNFQDWYVLTKNIFRYIVESFLSLLLSLFWLLFIVIFVIIFIICCYFCYYCYYHHCYYYFNGWRYYLYFYLFLFV